MFIYNENRIKSGQPKPDSGNAAGKSMADLLTLQRYDYFFTLQAFWQKIIRVGCALCFQPRLETGQTLPCRWLPTVCKWDNRMPCQAVPLGRQNTRPCRASRPPFPHGRTFQLLQVSWQPSILVPLSYWLLFVGCSCAILPSIVHRNPRKMGYPQMKTFFLNHCFFDLGSYP